MATCKDCIHCEACERMISDTSKMFKVLLSEILKMNCDIKYDSTNILSGAEICQCFQDRSRFVELPDVSNYDAVTTIDEAIDHCYQIATSTDETVYAECKAEHMRLCGWLGDLKRRIVAKQALKERENNDKTDN